MVVLKEYRMQEYRSISRVVKGMETTDGAGVRLVRVFGSRDVADFDPFLMMDAFDNSQPEQYIKGFPWHPHRGIETITYLIEGNVEHGDSLGNKGNIFNGDCQWMTAGSGIIHQEMPQPPGRMIGVQIWLNMPAKDKMAPPAYGDILSANVPVIGRSGLRSAADFGHSSRPQRRLHRPLHQTSVYGRKNAGAFDLGAGNG